MLDNVTKLFAEEGIPVFAEYLPGAKGVSMQVVMFVGACDDETHGPVGTFHCFEHMPFEGTKYMPDGSEEFDATLGRFGAKRSAATARDLTFYSIDAPLGCWDVGLRHMLDLVSGPLLREKDVHSERVVIEQEIRDDRANPYSGFFEWGMKKLYGKHPIANSILGTIGNLKRMGPEQLRRAHLGAYSWRRACVLFSGAVRPKKVAAEVSKFVAKNPLPQHAERRGCVSYGKIVPLSAGSYHRRSKEPASFAHVSYPLHLGRESGVQGMAVARFLTAAYTAGDMGPLLEQLRKRRGLVYEATAEVVPFIDAPSIALLAPTSRKNAKEALQVMLDLPRDAKLRSGDWYQLSRDFIRGKADLEPVHPQASVEFARQCLHSGFEPVAREKLIEATLLVSYIQYVDGLERLLRNPGTVGFTSRGSE